MKLQPNLWHNLGLILGVFILQMTCSKGGALFGTGALLLALSFYLKRVQKLSSADVIFCSAFFINVWYVLFSWGNVRQYDYFNFYMHVDYFIEHQFFLSHPASYLQSVYFQPPLWGGLSALVARLVMMFDFPKQDAFDYVRFLSLFAVNGSYIIFWRLMEKFHFKKEVALSLFALFSLAPIHGIFANLVNNDAVVYFLMLSSIYLTKCWYDNGTLKKAFLLAGVLFAAGMIKFSGLMVAPAIGVLGLIKFFSGSKIRKHTFIQLCVITLGGILGFSWGFFLLYFHIGLVPPPIDVSYQSMTGYTIFERLFYFQNVFEPFVDVRQGIVESNVWFALIKTFLFGEWPWSGMFYARVLYVLGILLAFMAVCSFFLIFKYQMGKDFSFNIFIVVLVFTVFGAWINFWLDYPYFCSSEFRYTAILWPMSLLWMGNIYQKMPRRIQLFGAWFVALFILMRIMLYLNTI